MALFLVGSYKLYATVALGYTILITCAFKYFPFLLSHTVCVIYRITPYFFFNGLHPALHLRVFRYIMKRSPITVGGQGITNHWGGKFYR